MPRHAIYFAPARESLLWNLGVRWLGRDPETGDATVIPEVPGFAPARIAALTAPARRYGWHATLKAPFALRAGIAEYDLAVAARALAARLEPVPLPPLEVRDMDGFLALVPVAPSSGVDRLAALCVEVLDPWRAPLDDAERARRDDGRLDARSRELLERWGYPSVFEQFRFHLTLTGPLGLDERRRLETWLAEYFEPALARPGQVDALAIFEEPAPGEAFRLVRRIALGRT
jgi:putative phosphonate metabolism protein